VRDTSHIRELLGEGTHRSGREIIWRTDRVSLRRLNRLLELDDVEDVELMLVPDLDESWDGEPYNTRYLVRVTLVRGRGFGRPGEGYGCS
jgi:hypothetical protein